MQQLGALPPPLLTCEAVLAEAGHLLSRGGGEAAVVPALLEKGVLRVGLAAQEQAPHLRRLMQRYRDVPMSLADACLVRMSELIDDLAVMTLDSDFRIYRRRGRNVIPLIAPADI